MFCSCGFPLTIPCPDPVGDSSFVYCGGPILIKDLKPISHGANEQGSGPEALALILRLLSGHFDRVDSGAGYKQLQTFGVPNGRPFCDFCREFRVVVSAATGIERVLAPGAEIVWR